MSQLVSIKEASKLFGVTPKTLRLWDRQGILKCSIKTTGNHRRYSLDDLNEILDEVRDGKSISRVWKNNLSQ